MALRGPIPVQFADVFPQGAFVLGVEPINDFDKLQAGTVDPQERDKDTGERLWAVRVLDADPEARAGSAEVKVKLAAPVQPVPPEPLAGTPFRPAEFVGLTVTPYVDTNRTRPKLAYSLRAREVRPVAAAATVGKGERPGGGS